MRKALRHEMLGLTEVDFTLGGYTYKVKGRVGGSTGTQGPTVAQAAKPPTKLSGSILQREPALGKAVNELQDVVSSTINELKGVHRLFERAKVGSSVPDEIDEAILVVDEAAKLLGEMVDSVRGALH